MLGVLSTRRKEGGTYAMRTRDSMAIVATEHGGIVPCPEDGRPRKGVIRRCHGDVREISDRSMTSIRMSLGYSRVSAINSQDEDRQLHSNTTTQRQLYCWPSQQSATPSFCAMSMERRFYYEKRSIQNDRWSEHGLVISNRLILKAKIATGLLSVCRVWLVRKRKARGHSRTSRAARCRPHRQLAVQPYASAAQSTKQKSYPDQIKPFNLARAVM